VRRELTERARDFNIILDDVSITELSFGKEYTQAVESKQVAQQEAQRAAFVVERAKQEKQQKILQAEGEAEAAQMISFSQISNPGSSSANLPMMINQYEKTAEIFVHYSVRLKPSCCNLGVCCQNMLPL
jgi:regulator of protease activity HflC (stomatin/prohibitin superfamily)